MVLLLVCNLAYILLIWRYQPISLTYFSDLFLPVFRVRILSCKYLNKKVRLLYTFKVFIKKHSSLRNSIKNKNRLAEFQNVRHNSLSKWLTVLITSLTQLFFITSLLENSTQTNFVKQEVINQIFQLTFHSPYISVKVSDLTPLCTEMSLYFNILL